MSVKNNPHPFLKAKVLMATQIRQLDLKAKPFIYRIELKIKSIDAISWLEAQQAKVKVYGANQENSAAIAGIGEALTIKGRKFRGQFAEVLQQLRQYLTPQYPYLQWYGGFCFDQGCTDKSWEGFGAYRFVLPRFELARDGAKMIFSCNLIGSLDERKRRVILKELECINDKSKRAATISKALSRKDLPSINRWNDHVDSVLQGIKRNDYVKVVLARKTVLKFAKPLNALAIFRQLHKVTPHSYHFYFQFGSATFLGASPERLYKRRGRHILSDAIAGTSARGKTGKEDILLKSKLIASLKNNNEHRFVVEAIKENLNPFCQRMEYQDKPGVISLGNGHHLITHFEGELKEGVKDEDVLQSLHPTPAVAGVPRDKSLAVIRRMEKFARGWYAGPLGYVGLDWVEFVVGIRSGLIKGKTLSVFAGAGIVQGSDPRGEWDEIENKISNFIKVVK